MFVRILSSAFLVSALAVMPAAAQAQQGGGKSTTTTTTSGPVVTSDEIVLEGDANPRPALPTINGDTGLWYVPTAETLPAKKWSASLFRANSATAQGLTDVSQIGSLAPMASATASSCLDRGIGYATTATCGRYSIQTIRSSAASRPTFHSSEVAGRPMAVR